MDQIDSKVIEDIKYLNLLMARTPMPIFGQAQFWKSLGEKHTQLISEYGFRKFKRTINFEYNQWGVHSLKDQKIRRLLRLLLRRRKIPLTQFMKARVLQEDTSDVRWPDYLSSITGETLGPGGSASRRRILAYTVYVHLLWEYAMLEDGLGCLRQCEEPTMGAPLPITYAGRLISQDLAMSSLELNLITSFCDMSSVTQIAEIGAGYGRLAFVVAKLFPHVKYHIFDVPPALAISQNYLECIVGKEVVSMSDNSSPHLASNSVCRIMTFLPHQLEMFPEDYFDLVINVSSFDEMSPGQVENYFSLINEKCNGWLYLKGHGQSPSPGHRLGVNEFPYRPSWKEVYRRQDPVVGSFVERVYDLRGKSKKVSSQS